MQPACECGGRRHVLAGGKWKECSCLRAERRARLWRGARIPARHDRETWASLRERFRLSDPKALALAARAFRGGRSEGALVLAGDVDGRELAAALLLRAALDGGLSAELFDLRRLIDFSFGKAADDAPPGDPGSRSVVALRLGDEPKNPRNKVELEAILRARRDAGTALILVASSDPESLGALYGSDDVAEAIGGRFSVVRVAVPQRAARP